MPYIHHYVRLIEVRSVCWIGGTTLEMGMIGIRCQIWRWKVWEGVRISGRGYAKTSETPPPGYEPGVKGATRNASVLVVSELLFNDIGSKTNSSSPPRHQPSEEPHRLSSASAARTAQYSRFHIQPECGETAGLCFVLEWQNPHSVTVDVVGRCIT